MTICVFDSGRQWTPFWSIVHRIVETSRMRVSEWVSVFLKLTKQFFSYIIAKKHVNFQWNDDDVRFWFFFC